MKRHLRVRLEPDFAFQDHHRFAGWRGYIVPGGPAICRDGDPSALREFNGPFVVRPTLHGTGREGQVVSLPADLDVLLPKPHLLDFPASLGCFDTDDSAKPLWEA